LAERVNIKAHRAFDGVTHSCPSGLRHNYGLCVVPGSDVTFDVDGSISMTSEFMKQIAEGADEAALQVLRNHMSDGLRYNGPDDPEQLDDVEKIALKVVQELKSGMSLVLGYVVSKHIMPSALPSGWSTTVAGMQTTMVDMSLVVGPILAVPQVMLNYVDRHRKWTAKWAKTADLASNLVKKTSCLSERLVLTETDFLSSGRPKAGILIEKLENTCDADTKAKILKQMVASTKAMHDMFTEVMNIGKCLYPIGDNKDAQMTCIEKSLPLLRHTGGNMGVLFSAITLATSFSKNSDAMLSKEFFGSLIQNVWKSDPLNDDSLVEKLLEVPTEGQPVACSMLFGVQKAYEHTFNYLKDALAIWMQTFGRDISTVGTALHPCRKVVQKLKGNFTGEGYCKHNNFPSIGNGMCTDAMNTEVWMEEDKQQTLDDAELINDALR